MNDLLSIADLSRRDIWDLLLLARKLKAKNNPRILDGKTVGLIFHKPSTRTTVSFAVGISQLGGQPLILNADVLQIKRGESPRDTARVLSRYLDALVIRAHHHDDLLEMARVSSIPIINGLTDLEHPCQVLADLLTIMDHKKLKNPKHLKGFRLAYLGDGNNVAHSLMLAAAMLGMQLTVATPPGYEPKSDIRGAADRLAKSGLGRVHITNDPEEAVRGAHGIYTDVWTSMGQEAEGQKRREAFAAFQVNKALVQKAAPGALVMHCLPAHRGEEITDDVLEGPQSVVFDQAENRLHVQKAILATLLSKKKKK